MIPKFSYFTYCFPSFFW